MSSRSQHVWIGIALGAALLSAGGALAQEPANGPEPAETASKEATENPATRAAASAVAWDAERGVFRAPADHEAVRIAEELGRTLAGAPYFADKSYDVRKVADGLYLKRVGAEHMTVALWRPGFEQGGSCVQGPVPDTEVVREASSGEGRLDR